MLKSNYEKRFVLVRSEEHEDVFQYCITKTHCLHKITFKTVVKLKKRKVQWSSRHLIKNRAR